MIVEIILGIMLLAFMFGVQYGIFIILNWYNDRGIYVKEDNNNVMTLFLKLWAYVILFFSIIGIGHYIASPPILKKRLILLMEVAFSTVIFNLVYVRVTF